VVKNDAAALIEVDLAFQRFRITALPDGEDD